VSSDDEGEFYCANYPEVKVPEPTDYQYKLETSHKDFIRSLVQFGDKMFLSASEDKTIKLFYF
jgi:hypothetical protein